MSELLSLMKNILKNEFFRLSLKTNFLRSSQGDNLRQKPFFISKDVRWNKNCISYVIKKKHFMYEIFLRFRTIQSSQFFLKQRKLQFLINIKAHFVDRIYFSQGTLLLVIWNTTFLLFFLLFLNLKWWLVFHF